MSSAGHVLDIINRMRQNRAIRTSNKQKIRSNNREVAHSDKDALHFKEVPKEELERIKSNIREKSHRERRILIIAFVITAVLVIALMYILFN